METRRNTTGYYKHPGNGSIVEGNVVRKTVSSESAPVRLKPNRRQTVRSNALKRQKARFTLLGMTAAVFLTGLSIMLLSSIDQNNRLTEAVSARESEIEKLLVSNDAREYEINCSVDLGYVISVATEELGMVRSNASQIITYSVKNSEYLHQVARVPME